MKSRNLTLWGAVLLALLLLAGCGGGGSGGGGSSPAPEEEGPQVGFAFTMPYVLAQTGGAGGNGLQAGIRFFSADDVMRGVLLAVNVNTFEHFTFDWSVYLDEDTLDVQSNKTVVLPPATYNFHLLLIRGDHHYAGSKYLYKVKDGTNTIPFVIRPVIGDITTDVDIVEELADFRFDYDPDELSGFDNPQIGIIVDDGEEQIFAVNPATGLSEYMLLGLTAGTHHMQLRFYEGETQRGKSLPAQEYPTVSPGVGVTMDLVALHGEADFDLAYEGGDALFRFLLPAEVVDEAGADDLEIAFSAVGDETGLHEGIAGPVTPMGGNYVADMTLGAFNFENVVMSVAFTDLGDDPPYSLGGCMFAVTLSSNPVTELCEITLVRRSVVQGQLLATVAVNVWTELNEPVPGAIVSANGDDVGVTGGGATPGYVKLMLPAGDYTLTARSPTHMGSTDVSLSPLGLYNVDIVLDTPLP